MRLWNDQVSNAAVLAFFATEKPTTAKGRYMLARALLAQGNRAGAAALVRQAWRYQDCSPDVESKVLEMFGDILTRADHKARMDQRFYKDDVEAGLRQAKRLGGSELAIAKAWTAVIRRARNAHALLNDVPASARHDPGYIYARVVWLRHDDKLKDAAQLMLSAPNNAEAVVDPDQWWRERRILVRDLLDHHEPHTAYKIAVEAATPTRARLPRRQVFYRRLDRPALPARCQDRLRAVCAHHPGHHQSLCALARRLLAGPRGRCPRQPAAGEEILRHRRRL